MWTPASSQSSCPLLGKPSRGTAEPVQGQCDWEGVSLQGLAQMMFLPLPWEEAGAKSFFSPLSSASSSSLSLLSSREPHPHCSWPLLLYGRAENSSQVPPLPSPWWSAGEVIPWLSSLSGSQPLMSEGKTLKGWIPETLLVASLNNLFSKDSPGAWLGGEDASGKGQHSRINSAKSKIKLKRA